MSPTGSDAHLLRAHLRAHVVDDAYSIASAALICNGEQAAHLHLAVMTGPFLDLVLSGAKVIESRFHRVRRPPLFAAAPGDVIAFKQSSGPVRGMATVSRVEFLDLERISLELVRSRYEEELAATTDEFWAARSRSRWVSLLSLSSVRGVTPVSISKRDRQGWVRYPPYCEFCGHAGGLSQPQ